MSHLSQIVFGFSFSDDEEEDDDSLLSQCIKDLYTHTRA